MASFTDATGRVWPFRRITLGDCDELAAVGLDVEAVSDDLDRLAELATRRRAFAAVLWWFVGDAVTAAGLTPEAFHRALDGDALASAVYGVRDAVVQFFPFPPAIKSAMIARMTSGPPPTAAPAGYAGGPSSSPPSPASTPTG